MNGLSGARVLLLDDEPKEALPVIKALSKVGVAVAYFDGSAGEIPRDRDRLCGIRLAILDMDLGFGGPPENMASTMLQTLSRIIRSDNGPLGVLIWTNHPEQKEMFTRFIYDRTDLPRPIFVAMLKKANFIVRSTSDPESKHFSIRKLSKELVKALAENSPLECMQIWEGSAFRAATNVTNTLAELTESPAANLDEWRRQWQDETLKLLLVISRARAEKLHTSANCISSMLLALNPLHSDRMDALVEDSAQQLSRHSEQVMAAKGSSSVQRRARVNSMLHMAPDHLEVFGPGNLYLWGSRNRPSYLPTIGDVLRDSIEGKDAKRAENFQIVTRNCRQCGIEITPVCDYVQNKMGLSRIIVGFALPYDRRTLIKSSGFLKRIGPFDMRKDGLAAGAYYLYLDSRYIVATKPNMLTGMRAWARLRPQLLADIQSWASYQTSRQGVMLLPDKDA